MKNVFTTTSVAMIAMLALSSCGGDGAEPEDASPEPGNDSVNETEGEQQTVSADDVYEFHYGSNPGPYQELEVRVNDELLEVAEDYRENRVFDSVVISAGDHPDSQCSVKLDFNYADGVRESIEGDTWENFYSTYEMESYAPEGLNGDGEPYSVGWNTIAVEDRYMDILGMLPGSGYEISEDFESAVKPVGCASSPADVDSTAGISFKAIAETSTGGEPWTQEEISDRSVTPEEIDENISENDGELRWGITGRIAEIDVSVMVNGDIHVVNTNVEGYNYNEQHGWLPEGMTVDSNGDIIEG